MQHALCRPYYQIKHIKSTIHQHMRDLNSNKPFEEVVHATAYHERSTGHNIEWDDVKILDTPKYPWLLPYKESIATSKYVSGPPKGMNSDGGHKMPHYIKKSNISLRLTPNIYFIS